MDVITLGTGSPIPDPLRAGPSTLVKACGRQFLVDCGRGVLLRAAACGSGALWFDAVLLTHLHSDHITDLNDIITTRWAMSPVPNPLTVIGPVGTKALVERIVSMLELDISYRRAHHDDLDWDPPVEVREVTSGVVIDDGDVRITCEPTNHAPVQPTVGYRFEANGAVAAIAGDTVPCEGLAVLTAEADVYVQTVVRPDLIEALGFARLNDVVDYHSSVTQAAETATASGVRTLVLTHLVPPPAPGSEHEWTSIAAASFAGTVIAATDTQVVFSTQ